MNMICHPLRGVCAVLNLVGAHIERREWCSPSLTEALLPNTVRVVYKSGVETDEREDALPIVAYKVTGVSMAPFLPQGIPSGKTVTETSVGIGFRVSTTSEALTSELCIEICGLLMANHADLRDCDIFIQKTGFNGVQKDQTGYYIADISVEAVLNRPVWKKSSSNGILREVSIQASGS